MEGKNAQRERLIVRRGVKGIGNVIGAREITLDRGMGVSGRRELKVLRRKGEVR